MVQLHSQLSLNGRIQTMMICMSPCVKRILFIEINTNPTVLRQRSKTKTKSMNKCWRIECSLLDWQYIPLKSTKLIWSEKHIRTEIWIRHVSNYIFFFIPFCFICSNIFFPYTWDNFWGSLRKTSIRKHLIPEYIRVHEKFYLPCT